MKKSLTMLIALALVLMSCAIIAIPACADGLTPINVEPLEPIGVSLGSYEMPEIESIDVEPLEPIGVSLGSYETHEIESIDVEPLEPIEVSLGSYETHEIESIDVEPLEPIGVSLGSYETHEIESINVEPLKPIEVNLWSYETPELTSVDVEPLKPIEVELGSYDVPEIKGLVPEEIEPFYVNLVSSFDQSQLSMLSGLSEIEVADFVQRQYGLVSDLADAFALAGINAHIDPIRGTLPIDASLLYATNEYKVSDTGKDVLRSVFNIYCSVLSGEKYRDAVSRILVVGHTDTDGSYDYNVGLSLRRAEAVRDFLLSPECGIADLDWLAQRIVAEGHSYDELVYNADGTENKAASRRVELGFELAMGQESE